MSSRTRTFTTGTSTHETAHEQFDLDAYSDDELETLLFQDDESDKKKSAVNLPTITGLSMILVGILYAVNEFLGVGVPVGPLVTGLSVLAGLLIVAMGFGLIRMDPKKKIVRSKERKKAASAPPLFTTAKTAAAHAGRVLKDHPARRLKKSRDRKVFGVAGGIAEYFGWDPTLVRVAFVVATIATSGSVTIPLYLALAFFLPQPEAMTLEERIRVIRDS